MSPRSTLRVSPAAAAAAPRRRSEPADLLADPGFGVDPAFTAGLDEVGRGCLFGPVFAAAVVLERDGAEALERQGLTDSKKLTALRREALVPTIQHAACDWALGQASAAEIDREGIRRATELAMLRALDKLRQPPRLLLVDGVLPLRGWTGEQFTVVRGDSLHASIAAASVLAKQARDRLIRELAVRFPGYGLEHHAGYGTAVHRAALQTLGPTPLHRRSFLGKLLPAPGLRAPGLSAPGTSVRSQPPVADPPAP